MHNTCITTALKNFKCQNSIIFNTSALEIKRVNYDEQKNAFISNSAQWPSIGEHYKDTTVLELVQRI